MRDTMKNTETINPEAAVAAEVAYNRAYGAWEKAGCPPDGPIYDKRMVAWKAMLKAKHLAGHLGY